MLTSKLLSIVTFLTVAQMFGPVKLVPLVREITENDNILREQAFLKSQYETIQKRPIYYMLRRGYDYQRPQIPFEGESADSGEVVDVFEGYVYKRPDEPFTYPPTVRTTTEFMFPPASARTII